MVGIYVRANGKLYFQESDGDGSCVHGVWIGQEACNECEDSYNNEDVDEDCLDCGNNPDEERQVEEKIAALKARREINKTYVGET